MAYVRRNGMSEERTTLALKDNDFEVNFVKSPSRLRKTVHNSSFFFGVIKLLVERSADIIRGIGVGWPGESPVDLSDGSLSVEKDTGRGGTAGVVCLEDCVASFSLIEGFTMLVEVLLRSKPGLRRLRWSAWSSEDCEPSSSPVRSFARFEECLRPKKDLVRFAMLISLVCDLGSWSSAFLSGGDAERERDGDDGLDPAGDLKLRLCEKSLVAEVRLPIVVGMVENVEYESVLDR